MDETMENEVETAEAPESPRPRRKYKRRIVPARRAARSEPKTDQQSDDELFWGLSKNTCLAACIEAAAEGKPCCWISQEDCCVNPLTTGLHARHKNNPKVQVRFNRVMRWYRMQQAKAS